MRYQLFSTFFSKLTPVEQSLFGFRLQPCTYFLIAMEKNIKVINWIYNPEGPLIVYSAVSNKRVDKNFIPAGVGGQGVGAPSDLQ